MPVVTKLINLRSKGELDIINITDEVAEAVKLSRLENGVATIFVPGSTGGLTTIEYEPGLLKDFPAMLERIAPKNLTYEHEKRWHDGNGHSHVRASLVGPSLAVPFVERKLTLGTWQQIVFIELDIHSRARQLVVQIVGE
ncbi:secondary thiamine-phosphate synthase enzyme YjbQ [Candidatus Hecatella orcuttiae]|jgi:secondary thiamine-phosphate synthase enzyme|uniref:secondary thiamine-phosphate synthase enzyme YjbQ n=1 Tax=Candidatus Hecatella orcuttiae TaxID=1935119 RepID=UPI002867DA52|nr:secondary thiamine-phosphate synthase enzyme YjbQ [Candidatus Hecatella orcuttiae]